MAKANKASILAIGTEVVSGEIVNTNAAWLADQLIELGFRVISHYVAADDREDILAALSHLSERSGEIFVIGGLGPTSDDITRTLVGEFAGQELKVDEQAYRDLESQFSEMGRSLTEGHRWQCHFPKQAVKFKNSVGTALGFQVRAESCNISVLPGPPGELKSMWTNELLPKLKEQERVFEEKLVKWKCLGKGESEISEMTEEFFKGTGWTLGYRASVPFVFVKVWVPFKEWEAAQAKLQAFEEKLGELVVAKDNEDPLADFLDNFEGPYKVYDRAGYSEAMERLKKLIARCDEGVDYICSQNRDLPSESSDYVCFEPQENYNLRVFGRHQTKKYDRVVAPPFKVSESLAKRRKSLVEKFLMEAGLHAWMKEVESQGLPVVARTKPDHSY